MIDPRITLRNLNNNDIPKYKRIVNAFIESIETNEHKTGESIPSINDFSKNYKISRDTVYKAYTLLKEKGYINSTPNKGYYIAENKIKILILISTFKAYKEVFYHSFINCLPKNVVVDLQFHHYNIKNFKTMLDIDNGKYYKYIVMGFDHPEVEETLSKIDNQKLLLIDWNICYSNNNNYVFQDFGKEFYKCLDKALHLFQKYNAVHFLYPEFTYHPYESVEYFIEFCLANNLNYDVIRNFKDFAVTRNVAYISVSDRMLYEFLEQCRMTKLELGKDVGILSYNDTPLKKFIYKGISVVSVDFREFGVKAAEFVMKDNVKVENYLTTSLVVRESL